MARPHWGLASCLSLSFSLTLYLYVRYTESFPHLSIDPAYLYWEVCFCLWTDYTDRLVGSFNTLFAKQWGDHLVLSGALTCLCHQFLPTLTVPKSDSLPALHPPPPPPPGEDWDDGWGKAQGLQGSPSASSAGIDGTLGKAVDGTNPESMFQ